MNIIKRELNELPILFEENIDNESIKQMILDSDDGTVFITDKDYNFKGIITEGDYIRYIENIEEKKEKYIRINTNCKFVYNNENIMKELAFIHLEYENIRVVPVLNDAKKILCAYSFKLDYVKHYFKIFSELYEAKLYGILDVHKYLITNNYKNIGIYGNSILSTFIKYELNNDKYADISVYYISDDKKEYLDKIWRDKGLDIIICCNIPFKSYLKIKYSNLEIQLINQLVKKVLLFNFIDKLNESYIYTFCVSIPVITSINNLRKITGLTKENLFALYTEFNMIYSEELFNCISKRAGFIFKENRIFYDNYKSKYINCINGERLTLNQPETYNNTIYLLGNCVADSYFAEDKYTVGSYLQNMLLKMKHNFTYRVVARREEGNLEDTLKYLNLKRGDIVIFLLAENSQIPFSLNLTKQFNEFYEKEDFFFGCPAHCNYKGYKLIAEEIFKYLKSNYFGKKELEFLNGDIIEDSKKVINKKRYNEKVFEDNKDLAKYINYIKDFKVDNVKKVGAVVMNCNPFTLGHRYLIETALKDVDWLYIFVVEEDKSIFSFNDRFELVKQNTEDLKNVTVIPSGNFIISTVTFPGYFTKDTPTTAKIDTSTDVEVFAQHIAPTLGINIRFVGEEPFDLVTNQYNRSIKEILPRYNIDVKIIERIEIDGQIVSASKVRDLIDKGNFDDVKKFLPDKTFNYICKLNKGTI